ncbi:hypothetical protein EYF80_044799 [Liparis tanakae]|uniref:Uncharacterized protein n=1 Tax=Liparis tanakae TaxID=230148 RepID=A0A4Z2FWM2_9TELE|nr:hypothetical protein EYF80_044799 [Liparis tanakae]
MEQLGVPLSAVLLFAGDRSSRRRMREERRRGVSDDCGDNRQQTRRAAARETVSSELLTAQRAEWGQLSVNTPQSGTSSRRTALLINVSFGGTTTTGSCLGLILRLDEPRQRETQHAAQGHLLNPGVQESSVMHFLLYAGGGCGAGREAVERRPDGNAAAGGHGPRGMAPSPQRAAVFLFVLHQENRLLLPPDRRERKGCEARVFLEAGQLPEEAFHWSGNVSSESRKTPLSMERLPDAGHRG